MTTGESDGNEIRIFIVDDHEIVRTGLKLLLAQWPNIKLAGEASNGQEVLDLAESKRADIVLMDVAMPVMDGLEATDRLLTKHKNLKVIMLTSKGDEGTILAALSSGASGYCLKDVSPQRLYNGMQCVLKGDLWLDSEIASVIIRSFPKNAGKVSEGVSDTSQPPAENLAMPKPKIPMPVGGKGNLRLQSAEYLSSRELEVLALIVDGLSNQAIADKLVISIDTVKTHIRHIMEKMSVSDRTQAAIKAIRNNLVE